MENFFKQPLLDKLYDFLSRDFEENLLSDKNESEQYYNIVDKQKELYNLLEKLIISEKETKKNFKQIMLKLKNCSYQKTEYLNRKYFKLGFTYAIDLIMPENIQILERDIFSQKVHNFLYDIRNKAINKKQKILLIDFINNLNNVTKTQKRRFFMYYNLVSNSDKVLDYSDIGKIENCSISAIKTSIFSIVSKLVNLEGTQKIIFQSIMVKYKV